MRVEKFTRRSRRLVALLLAVLCFVPTSIVRGQTLLHTVDNPVAQPGAWFGFALTSLGDVDGDGAPDFAVGAPNQNVGANVAQGQVLVVSGVSGTILHTLNDPDPQASASFGRALAGTGDVNGDGIPDVAVGAPM
ncbi:MAG: integrin alpha, partial [Candidatus Rokuibacteriota bacterium]